MGKNTGKYKLSAEGVRAHRNLCKDLKTISEGFDAESKAAFDAGNMKGARDAMASSAHAEADANKFGCSWAS